MSLRLYKHLFLLSLSTFSYSVDKKLPQVSPFKRTSSKSKWTVFSKIKIASWRSELKDKIRSRLQEIMSSNDKILIKEAIYWSRDNSKETLQYIQNNQKNSSTSYHEKATSFIISPWNAISRKKGVAQNIHRPKFKHYYEKGFSPIMYFLRDSQNRNSFLYNNNITRHPLDIIKSLLESKVDPNRSEQLYNIIPESKDCPCFGWIDCGCDGRNPDSNLPNPKRKTLHVSTTGVRKKVYSHGSEVTGIEWVQLFDIPLHTAVELQDTKLIQLLIDYNANIDNDNVYIGRSYCGYGCHHSCSVTSFLSVWHISQAETCLPIIASLVKNKKRALYSPATVVTLDNQKYTLYPELFEEMPCFNMYPFFHFLKFFLSRDNYDANKEEIGKIEKMMIDYLSQIPPEQKKELPFVISCNNKFFNRRYHTELLEFSDKNIIDKVYSIRTKKKLIFFLDAMMYAHTQPMVCLLWCIKKTIPEPLQPPKPIARMIYQALIDQSLSKWQPKLIESALDDQAHLQRRDFKSDYIHRFRNALNGNNGESPQSFFEKTITDLSQGKLTWDE